MIFNPVSNLPNTVDFQTERSVWLQNLTIGSVNDYKAQVFYQTWNGYFLQHFNHYFKDFQSPHFTVLIFNFLTRADYTTDKAIQF